MAECTFTDEQLALILQMSRDFAFEQIEQGMPLLPFATVVKSDGDMDFTRFADPGTDKTPEEVHALTQSELAKEATKGGVIAGAIVSGVRLKNAEDGMHNAIRIEVEAPGFARQFLAFYALGTGEDDAQSLTAGKLVPFDAEPSVFDA